jgi:hypothetical protein
LKEPFLKISSSIINLMPLRALARAPLTQAPEGN